MLNLYNVIFDGVYDRIVEKILAKSYDEALDWANESAKIRNMNVYKVKYIDSYKLVI